MSTTVARRPAVIVLHRPWWRQWLDRWQMARAAREAAAAERALWRSLEGLGDATLRDIGAPERARARPDELRLLDRAYW